MPNCKYLFDKQPHPSKLIEPIERQLRELFERSIVYVPIAIVSFDKFDAHELNMYAKKYIAEFEAQFEVQVRKRGAKHRLHKLFTKKSNWTAIRNYAVFYRNVLMELGIKVDANAGKNHRVAATNENKTQKRPDEITQSQKLEIYTKLENLLEKINKYGHQAFSDARGN